MSIKVLTADVASKIAAGEVIERPASAVKELIENALDAGARQITVEIRGGGLQMLRVTDDGCGIAFDELETAFQRHATSKISSADDLFRIASLGFRGEALPSVAAVADVNVVSRAAEHISGGYIALKNGERTEHGQKGCAPGTMVSVSNLFKNVPARLKFLKSASNEASRITAVVSHYAMAYPQIRFTLINEGRLSLQTTGKGDLREVLAKIYGTDVATEMLPLSVSSNNEDGVAVQGLVSSPSLTRANRNYLSFFVNGRWIHSRMLSYAVEEAYHTLLPVGRHPLAVLSLRLPAPDLDVNVHPGKTEVKFLREREVFATVQRAVRQTVTAQMSVPAVLNQAASAGQAVQRHFQPWERLERQQASTPSAWEPLRPPVPQAAPLPQMPQTPPASTTYSRLPILRVVGQTANTFIIAEGPQGIYLIDQHRAHERVLYERYTAEREQAAVSTQLLLEPLAVELTPRQQSALQDHLQELERAGFQVEPFGEKEALLRAVPSLLIKGDPADTLKELLDQAVEDKTSDKWRERIAITLSCRGAIKAGQLLTLSEMRELVIELEKTSIPPTCPHGAPTMVHLSQVELEKQFGRR